MKEYFRYFRNSLLFLILSLLVFLSLIFSLLFFYGKSDERINENRNKFRILRLNPTKNKHSRGTETSFGELPPDGFFSYQDSDGDLVLVSKFGMDEYICSGSCYCMGKEEERRMGSSVAIRGLKYLLVAATSASSVALANKYFNEECSSRMSSSCSSSSDDEQSVKSEVDECKKVMEEDNRDEKSFLCKGHCMGREKGWLPFSKEVERQYKENPKELEDMKSRLDNQRKGICENYKFEEIVIITTTKEESDPKKKFLKDILEPECVNFSKKKVFESLDQQKEVWKNRLDEEEFKQRLAGSKYRLDHSDPKDWASCLGSINGKNNPSINCVSLG